MEPIVREALLDLRDQAGDAEFVFTNPDTGTRYTDIKKSFSAACREAGITNFTFHDLRHTFGTRLADAGVDVVKIKELMSRIDCDDDALYSRGGSREAWSDHRLVGVSTKRQVCLKRKTAGPISIGTCRNSLKSGEPWRARTSDPLIKSQLLYQLS